MSTNYTLKSLDQILDETQLKVAYRIMAQIKSGLADPKSLRDYLRTQADVLEQRGVVADYLYYALCYKFNLR